MDPVFGIAVLCFIRTLMGSRSIAGLEFPLFFASGMLFYNLFNLIGQASLGAVEANMSLLNYQRIKPLDPIISRALLEMILSGTSMLVVLGSIAYFGFEFSIDSILGVIEAFFLLVFFSFGVGLFLATVSPFVQDFKKIAPVLLRPLFFLSGIFFSVNTMPESVVPYFMWNPILHGIELGRDALFESYTSEHADKSYLYISAVVSLTLGLMIFRRFRITLVTSGTIKLA